VQCNKVKATKQQSNEAESKKAAMQKSNKAQSKYVSSRRGKWLYKEKQRM